MAESQDTNSQSSFALDATSAVESLIRALEFHRLMFLYWATACRDDPATKSGKAGMTERVFREDVPGWKDMVEEIDAEGKFLSANEEVLNRYAEIAHGRFGLVASNHCGESEGQRSDATGKRPRLYWIIDDDSPDHLEKSSEAICAACEQLSRCSGDELVMPLARETRVLTRPGGQIRWRANVVVPWEYLQQLEGGLARARDARFEVAAAGQSRDASQVLLPNQQLVADLAVLWLLLRNLEGIRRDYPDAMSDGEYVTLRDQLQEQIDIGVDTDETGKMCAFARSPHLQHEDSWMANSVFMTLALGHHESFKVIGNSMAEAGVAISKSLKFCLEAASSRVKTYKAKIATIMVNSCRHPTGIVNAEFSLPSRALQMLRRYWTLAEMILQLQVHVHIGWRPHPLLHLIANVRDRVRRCFSHLSGITDARAAALSSDLLLKVLMEDDPGDLSTGPGWTSKEIQKVELFIARAGLDVGVREFDLTEPERLFISEAEHSIQVHEANLTAAWVDVNKRSEAARSDSSSSDSQKQFLSAEEQVGDMMSALAKVDGMLMSLSPKLRSLGARGQQVNTYAHVMQVQRHVEHWVAPILAELEIAEVCSFGIGGCISEYVTDAKKWEIDARLEIRTLQDLVFGLIHMNGDDGEEQRAFDASVPLFSRGQRLQAIWEAMNARQPLDADGPKAKAEAALGSNQTGRSAKDTDSSELPHGDRLNHMDRAILVAMVEKGYFSAETSKLPSQELLAKWAGYPCDTTLKNALTALVKAGLLDNARHHGKRGGYFLTQVGRQLGEKFQKS